MRARSGVRLLVALLLAFGAVSCGGSAPSSEDPAADPGMEMLANLPDCDRVEMDDTEVEADVPGLVLPEGSVVNSVLEQGPLTSVEGMVRMNPLEVRADYEQRDDVDLLQVEDEIFETEVLLRADGQRMYLLAVALCADGTALSAMIGPDSDESDLPEFRSDQ